ncbi:hypothetical protein WJX74_007238 [Apatococcus lobatus]|uniref:guanylate kinase n=1 Tax=Apatococcus lobatus TaxID=904363 RepID=A0AAW1RQT2_9CHLO
MALHISQRCNAALAQAGRQCPFCTLGAFLTRTPGAVSDVALKTPSDSLPRLRGQRPAAMLPSLAYSAAAVAEAPVLQRQASTMFEELERETGQLSTNPMVPAAAPLVVVLSGPSGVGKDAVIKRLQQQNAERLKFVVTATSRPMRTGEVDGIDYVFVSRQHFEQWIRDDELVEHALVYGEYKGIPRGHITSALAAGSDVVLRVDIQGAATIMRMIPNAILIFIVAESERALVQRLFARKTEPFDKMVQRAQTARNETAHLPNFQYVVVNREGHLEDTVAEIQSILTAERCSTKRCYPSEA